MSRPRVAIAGASGFIGTELMKRLKADYDLIALARSPRANEAGIEWRSCDLYSLLQAERGLQGADYAFYLVHSMMPHARLTQGSFEDMDLILADNFARAAARAGIKQIVYLGGIIPKSPQLSQHLRSRLEVEKTLASHQVPVTNVRASIVIGARGSSFQIIEKLVRRLPIMPCPRWTGSYTQPIALQDVLYLLHYCLGKKELYHQAFDVGGPDIVTYIELMRLTAKKMGKRRLIFTFPYISPWLSRAWLSWVTGAPRELAAPLIGSLKDPMLATNLTLQHRAQHQALHLEEALELALSYGQRKGPRAPVQLQHSDGVRSGYKDVRSVQRLPLPRGKDAIWLAEKYTIWLPRFLKLFIKVKVDSQRNIHFLMTGIPWPLLELSYSVDRSWQNRPLFYITGGLLVKKIPGVNGRLEFREVLGGEFVLAAIHDFTPRLPWFLYNLSQARLHLWVMNAFRRYLAKLDVRLY